MDFIFTVCDNAANEACPVWPGGPVTVHWGLEDPASVEGTEERRREAFEKTYKWPKERIVAFLAIAFDSLDGSELRERLKSVECLGSETDC